MSNALRYDALLVRALAAELDAALAGARLDSAFLERDTLRVTLLTRSARRSDAPPPSLSWFLHPSSGHLAGAVEHGASGRVQLAALTAIVRVTAPPDERVLVLELDAGAAPEAFARRIVIELITNQWNALAVGADGRITAVLRERRTRERSLRAGEEYAPPPPSARAGRAAPVTEAEWLAALGGVEPGARIAALLQTIAYTSPLNAAHVLGDADVSGSEAALERARERYHALVWTGPRVPVLLARSGGMQPYPVALEDQDEGAATLLAAFHTAAARAAAAPPEGVAEHALSAIARRQQALDRRERRLLEEQAGALAEAERLRTQATALLAQLTRVARGAAEVVLDDFRGGTMTVPLDPALSAADNATRLYGAARRRQRAAVRIPALLAAVARERARVERLAERIRSGTATAEEMAQLPAATPAAARDAAPALPYREYRTSSGLEVRVGRDSRANDQLTFRHSSPTDVWLHARDVAGAHVILRWPHADTHPPALDVAEAAVLAALHSRARTSRTVPVDWTRRKYVRKARKAAPGLVIPDRVRTLFVEPDPAVEVRMRV